ncbi:phage tail protein [Pseudomonas chlororaphis]|uniref:phage tail protein n=1 Tax=Pseudomonas chlororaphis TaxID=587753 RepID=UPI0015DE0D94|nr:phage tail protein [Pseudomonas chlororaphis]QLL11690.1 phage tail protein [Pseudomonas chlororaphis subsp. aurantiaca]
MYYFSPSNNQFYSDDINGSRKPEDCIGISDSKYEELKSGVERFQIIKVDDSGELVLSLRPGPTEEELAAVEDQWINSYLLLTDRLVARHRDEIEAGGPSTLSADKYTDLQRYRRSLREWPSSLGFPYLENRPTAPSWLNDSLG